MSNNLSRDLLNDLKTKQIAFFEARLLAPKARDEWRANLEKGHDALLDRKLGELASPDALVAVVEAALAHATFEAAVAAVAPVSKAVHAEVVKELRADTTLLGDYVPESARAKIDKLLERKGLIPARLIREVLEQDAMEEVMRDVLFDALKTFNDSVNPFFAEWGLPGLIKRFLPIGSGAVLKSMDAVRGEFDKRLEPEMRKFLQGFSRKALKKMADFTIASSDEPKSVGVRKAVAQWLYEQELKSLVGNVDDAGLELGQTIGLEITAHVVALEASKKRRLDAVTKFFAENGDLTLAEALAKFGITAKLDFDALAALSWPLVAAVLATEPVKAWFASLIGEFFDSIEAP